MRGRKIGLHRSSCVFLLLCILQPASQVYAGHSSWPSCGRSSLRLSSRPEFVGSPGFAIVNGVEAMPDEFPWIVSIQYTSRRGNGHSFSHYCAASILSPDILITAAHCTPTFHARVNRLPLMPVKIVAGCLQWNAADVDAHCQSLIVAPDAFLSHETFSEHSPQHDIALVFLPHALLMTQAVSTICLPPPDASCFQGMATIAGWGRWWEGQTWHEWMQRSSGSLRTADVNILPSSTCLTGYSSRRFNESLHVCAGFPSGARDACQGDSGGPLMAQQADRVLLIGTVSAGAGCARRAHPGIYVKVSALRPWIDARIVQSGRRLPLLL